MASRLLLFALALTASLPVEGGAQRITPSAVRAHASPGPRIGLRSGPGLLSDTATTNAARHPVGPFLLGGALAGALVGALAAASFHDSFCGSGGNAPGYTCSSTSTAEGAMIGAGFGVVAGWVLWAITKPANPPPRAGSR